MRIYIDQNFTVYNEDWEYSYGKGSGGLVKLSGESHYSMGIGSGNDAYNSLGYGDGFGQPDGTGQGEDYKF